MAGNPPGNECLHPFGVAVGSFVIVNGLGKLETQKLITHRFPLDRINDAFAVAKDKQRTGAIFVGLMV